MEDGQLLTNIEALESISTYKDITNPLTDSAYVDINIDTNDPEDVDYLEKWELKRHEMELKMYGCWKISAEIIEPLAKIAIRLSRKKIRSR